MGKLLQAKIVGLEQKNSELTTKIQELQAQSESQRIQHEESNKQIESDWQSKFDELKNTNTLQFEELGRQIRSKDELLEQRQLQLDQKELKKLARAYHDQEMEYKNDIVFWAKCLFYAGTLLVLSAAVSVSFSHGKMWYERFEYYLADVILLSAVWFCASQYSDYVKLRNDYANRKTIAQSFSNILNNLQEDEVIKNKFIEKATDVLCSPTLVSNKEPVVSKEALKQVGDLVKMFTNK